MKTIASCVEAIIGSQPFLEEALSKGIINFSALAEDLQQPITDMLKKPIKTGAIMMALRRYSTPTNVSNSVLVKKVLSQLGDITLRSNLCDYTFKNSKTLINSHARILELIKDEQRIFFTFTRGINESNIIISSSEKDKVKQCFKNEQFIASHEELSAISVDLPEDNNKVSGLYYHIFKQLAWENIPLYEVISTTNEFTVVIEDEVVDRAFSVIKNLKKQKSY